ncbi:MAG: hypothetical protein JST04_08965 [Bdellovibrionales bacterium]|nr:hypothetical protein [Bdellovibrionales bacterium]
MRGLVGLLALVTFFGSGLLVGSRFPVSSGSSPVAAPESDGETLANLRRSSAPTADRMKLNQASAARTSAATPVVTAESLADPAVRGALEKQLREVPYAVLKQVFLERQDEQWARQQERYTQPKEITEDELDHRADRLFDAFRQNANGNSYFVSRGEVKVRGGKSLPYVAFVEYYTSRLTDGLPNSMASTQTDATAARVGKEVCYASTIYFRVGEKYAADGQSNCLAWVPMRNQHPFALHANYNSKRLVPYFDTVSLALPGFGADGDVNSEWYDASSNRWTSVGKLRFDPVSKEEFTSLNREAQVETDGD